MRILLTVIILLFYGCYSEGPLAPFVEKGEEITIGGEPALSPDGRQLAFYRDYDIFVCDTAGGNEIRLTKSKDQDYSPQWSPDGTAIGFIRSADTLLPNFGTYWYNRLMVVNIVTQEELDVVPADFVYSFPIIQGRGFAWSPSSDRIAYMSDSMLVGSLRIISSDGNGTVWNKYNDLEEAVWSPDGSYIACINTTMQQLYVIAFRNNTVFQVSERNGVFQPSWLPDGKTIAFFTNQDGLVFHDLRTHEEKVIFNVGLQWHSDGFSLSPDGKKLIYTDFFVPTNPDERTTGYVYCYSIEEQTTTLLTTTRPAISRYIWSPDSKAIYFEIEKKIFKVATSQ